MIRKDYETAYRILRYHENNLYGYYDEPVNPPDGSVMTVSREALGAAMQSNVMAQKFDPLQEPFWWRCGVARWQSGKFVYNPDAIPF